MMEKQFSSAERSNLSLPPLNTLEPDQFDVWKLDIELRFGEAQTEEIIKRFSSEIHRRQTLTYRIFTAGLIDPVIKQAVINSFEENDDVLIRNEILRFAGGMVTVYNKALLELKPLLAELRQLLPLYEPAAAKKFEAMVQDYEQRKIVFDLDFKSPDRLCKELKAFRLKLDDFVLLEDPNDVVDIRKAQSVYTVFEQFQKALSLEEMLALDLRALESWLETWLEREKIEIPTKLLWSRIEKYYTQETSKRLLKPGEDNNGETAEKKPTLELKFQTTTSTSPPLAMDKKPDLAELIEVNVPTEKNAVEVPDYLRSCMVSSEKAVLGMQRLESLLIVFPVFKDVFERLPLPVKHFITASLCVYNEAALEPLKVALLEIDPDDSFPVEKQIFHNFKHHGGLHLSFALATNFKVLYLSAKTSLQEYLRGKSYPRYPLEAGAEKAYTRKVRELIAA